MALTPSPKCGVFERSASTRSGDFHPSCTACGTRDLSFSNPRGCATVIMVKFALIIVIAIVASGWARTIPAQPPTPRASGAIALFAGSATQSPGIGRDWRRFGSGLEDDRVIAAQVRFVASVEDTHPILWADRFGSGLEDDAPVKPLSVFLMSGLEGLNPSQSADSAAPAVRFGSGLEDDRPVVSRVRFGSGLEDDAPAHELSVWNEPGF